MPEKEIKGTGDTPDEAFESQEKSKKPLLLIIMAAAIFLIGIGAFSVVMGVFSSSPSNDSESRPDSLSDKSGKAIVSLSEDSLDIDALEQSIFGHDDAIAAGDLDELLDLAEEQESGMSEKDSIAMVSWLETEKAKLAEERADLEALKKMIDAREYQLRQLIAQVDQVESSRLDALARLYDGMKPAQVAPLITKLTDEQAVQVLLKMKPASAAKILGVLNTDRAARISANMITLDKEN